MDLAAELGVFGARVFSERTSTTGGYVPRLNCFTRRETTLMGMFGGGMDWRAFL